MATKDRLAVATHQALPDHTEPPRPASRPVPATRRTSMLEYPLSIDDSQPEISHGEH